MRLFLIALATLVVVIAAAFIVPSLIPSSVYREQIAAAVEKATGRSLRIDGAVSLRLLPTVKARIEMASLANAPGGEAETMAEIVRLDAGLALWPLLSRRVEIRSFVLNEAVIHLEKGKDGKANWAFEAAKTETEEPAADGGGTEPGELSELSLGDVRLVNALVTYHDLKSGDRYAIENINTKIELPSLDKPLKVDGDATYKGEKLALALELARPRAALESGTSTLSARLSGRPLSASFTGDATFGEAVKLEGDSKLDVPSVRSLSGWLGNPIEGKRGFGPLSVAGHLIYSGDSFAFENADLRFDNTVSKGKLKADLGAKIPFITASLSTDTLDLRPYIEESKKAVAAPGMGAAPPASAAWSSQPIDASALKAFNAEMHFSAGRTLVRDLKIDRSEIALDIKGGVLTADLKELALYGGKGKGTLALNAAGARPQLASNLALSGLDLASFMHDAAKTDRFEGTGAFTINVRGAGASQKEIVSSLAGNAAIDFKNGAIKGVDLVKIANAVNTLLGKNKQADQGAAESAADQAQGTGESTRFVTMGGTFLVNGGIATTNDFKMINDLISLSGRGSISLPAQTIDFRVDPGRDPNNNMKVSLLVRGPLSRPKVVPDVSGLIRNELDKALGKILGSSRSQDQEGTTGATGEQPSPAQQLLKGIFGGE